MPSLFEASVVRTSGRASRIRKPTLTPTPVARRPSTPELCFGIEIEGILAYTEDRLRRHLPPNTIIHKELSPDGERSLRSQQYPQNPWRSWAFGPTRRRYDVEALHIARELIQESIAAGHEVPDTKVCEDKDTMADYTTWQLVRDHSLVALDGDEKTALLTSIGVRCFQHADWDTHGIEFVSPPYLQADIHLLEAHVSSLLSSLHTASSHITTTKTCGLHVHIGLPDGSRLPIFALRNLALLSIAYEIHLSLLHPSHRGDSTLANDITSNKFAHFYAEFEDARDEQDRDGKIFESTAKSFEDIRGRIYPFHPVKDPYEHLASLMGPRASFINWTRISARDAATIEFRQHDGSLDEVEIGHWVRFCLAFVQLGILYAERGKQPLQSTRSWDCVLNLVNLVVEMVDSAGLPEDTAGCFISKYEAAVGSGRDPEEGMWEEKWAENDWDSGIEMS